LCVLHQNLHFVARTPYPVPCTSYLVISIDADILRIPVGPGALHVERYGHGGRAIVLLHGFGTSSFLWRAVGPALAVAGCTAYAVDMLGYGESDRPFEAGFGIASQAEYLDRALTALRVARAIVAGVDLGGTVALRLAAVRPERVEQLVLVNPRFFDDLPGRDVRVMQRNTARFALRISRGVLGAAPLLTPFLEGSVSDAAHMPPRLVARYLAPYVGREGVSHLLALARAVREEDVAQMDLGALRPRTLVVWGAADEWLDASVPKRLVEEIPRSRLVTLPDVGRLVPEEAPAQLSALLVDLVSPGAADAPAGEPPVASGDEPRSGGGARNGTR